MALKKSGKRNKVLTKQIVLGGIRIGGKAPVVVQSMTKTDTCDVSATVSQIKKLQSAGCEAIRVAVLNNDAALAIKKIKKKIKIPLIADIHFDHKLALQSIASGVDGLRINPGNIGSKLKVKDSLKASDVMKTVDAYRLFSEKYRYPTHIGISEAGPAFTGTVKSAVGLGILLSEGIGNTMRVSLTADPVEEVKVAFEILKSLHLRQTSPELISCPTCGRCQVDLRGIVGKVEAKLDRMDKPIKVAVMGCIVNGPGEAREADIGIAGGKGMGILFKNGKVVKTLKERELFSALMKEIKKM